MGSRFDGSWSWKDPLDVPQSHLESDEHCELNVWARLHAGLGKVMAEILSQMAWLAATCIAIALCKKRGESLIGGVNR